MANEDKVRALQFRDLQLPCRWKAFGGGSDVSPNPLDSSTAASNTEIISINNSVAGMLASGDVRKNYVMTGATWTEGGAALMSTPRSLAPRSGNLPCRQPIFFPSPATPTA